MVYFAPLLRTTKLLYNRLNGNSTYYQGLAGRTFGFESPRKEGRSGAYDGCLACRSCLIGETLCGRKRRCRSKRFVNPTQFNDKNDLVKYPRTPEADCRLLEECGAAFVFAPSVEEMYPEPDTRRFSYAPLDTVMEGAFRPGHFNGVCQIVSKLFDAVQPDRAYFGEKDFQQLAIIREMVCQMKYPLEIVGCPIVREEDGLALSSRNARLSAEERKMH